jgi:DNA-binding CsgD family transcriptional regulator
MKVFLSWSGRSSFEVANSLRSWLPTVLQAIKPWLSEEDINKGARWAFELNEQLETTNACIVCLTPDSLNSEWIHFESGAASKVIEKALICPYLVGLRKSDLSGPLSQFQASEAIREDTFKLLKSLNEQLGTNALNSDILTKTFDRFWPELESSLSIIYLGTNGVKSIRSQSEIIEEILERVRRIEEVHHSISTTNRMNIEGLSERERQVLKYTILGHSSSEISEILMVSPKTVKTYKYRIYEKLGIENDVQLIRHVIGAETLNIDENNE